MKIKREGFNCNFGINSSSSVDASKKTRSSASRFSWKSVGGIAKIGTVALGLLNSVMQVNANVITQNRQQCMPWDISSAPFISCMQYMSFDDCFTQAGIDQNSMKELKWKSLTHLWEIDLGAVKFKDHSFSSTGMMSWTFAKILSNSIELFSESFPGEISDNELNQIKSLTKWAKQPRTKLIPKEILEDYQKGHPLILLNEIEIETTLHAVQIVLVDNFLMVANKGLASRGPLEVFVIDRDSVTETMIENIVCRKSLPEYEQWLNSIYSTFGNKQSDLSLQIERSYPFSKTQVIGNCAWESLETAFYGWWMANCLKPSTKIRASDEDVEKAQLVFNAWLEHTQIHVLEDIAGYYTTFWNDLKKIVNAAPNSWAHPNLDQRFKEALVKMIKT